MPVPLTHVTVAPAGEQSPPFASRRTLHENAPPRTAPDGVFSCALAVDRNGRYSVLVTPAKESGRDRGWRWLLRG